MTPGKSDEPRPPSRADVISALTGREVRCPKHITVAHPIVYAAELAWVCDRCGPVVVARARLPEE